MIDNPAFIGYTTSTAFLNNFESDRAGCWMSMNANVDWVIYANGNEVVAQDIPWAGAPLISCIRLEMTYNPVTAEFWGSAAGEAFGPFPVTVTRPLTYFGMEADDSVPFGWCIANNLSIYTGTQLR